MLPKYDTPIEAYLKQENKVRTSRTFKIDFEKGRLLSQTIDGTDAVSQGIHVRTLIERGDYDMLPDTFGIALKEFFDGNGDPMDRDFILANLKRVIADALAPDYRILKLLEFEMEPKKNSVEIYMKIECNEGIFETGVELNGI